MKSCLFLFFLLVSYTTGFAIKPPDRSLNGRAPSRMQAAIKATVPMSEQPSPSIDLYGRYLNWIDRSPLVAKSVTAAVVGCIGDLMAQWLEAKTSIGVSSFSLIRFNAFFVSGLFFVGPFLHFWYDTLWAIGRWLDNHATKNKNLQVVAQVIVDQTLGVLLFFPTYFYAYELSEALVSLRAPLWSLATQKLVENLGSVFLMQYKVWPLVNYFVFKFVPERMRVLTSNLVSVFWNAYLCTRLA